MRCHWAVPHGMLESWGGVGGEDMELFKILAASLLAQEEGGEIFVRKEATQPWEGGSWKGGGAPDCFLACL